MIKIQQSHLTLKIVKSGADGMEISYIQCSLNEAQKKLFGYSFAQPHQSFLVNLFYVDRISGSDITMKNGDIIPISRRRLTEFKHEHLQFISKI